MSSTRHVWHQWEEDTLLHGVDNKGFCGCYLLSSAFLHGAVGFGCTQRCLVSCNLLDSELVAKAHGVNLPSAGSFRGL